MGKMSDDVRAEWEREREWALRQEERWDDFCADAAEAAQLRKKLERMQEEKARAVEERDVETQMEEKAKLAAARAGGEADAARAEAARAWRELQEAQRELNEIRTGKKNVKAKPERIPYKQLKMLERVDMLLAEGGRTVPEACGDVLVFFGFKATEKQLASMVTQYSKRKKRLTNLPK